MESGNYNIYDLLYAQARFSHLTVGSETYDKIKYNIKNNPDKYPWEHSLNKYPKETIDAYWDEINPKVELKFDDTPSKGWIEIMKEAKPMVLDTSRSLSEMLTDIAKREQEQADKAKLERKRQVKIWKKYFKIKYDLEGIVWCECGILWCIFWLVIVVGDFIVMMMMSVRFVVVVVVGVPPQSSVIICTASWAARGMKPASTPRSKR